MAVVEIAPLSAELVPVAPTPLWHIMLQLTHDDGSIEQRLYIMPQDTVEWRIAEYGYHPVDDLDEVVEMVLAEAVVTDEPGPGQAGYLYDDDSIQQARTRHRKRHRDRRKKLRIRDSTTATVAAPGLSAAAAETVDVRTAIKQACPIDPDLVQVKQEYVAQLRQRRRQQRQQDGSPIRRERPEQLRERLGRTPPPRS